jgi:hypothetical protein
MIGVDQLARMKLGAKLITAPGTLVDIDALVGARSAKSAARHRRFSYRTQGAGDEFVSPLRSRQRTTHATSAAARKKPPEHRHRGRGKVDQLRRWLDVVRREFSRRHMLPIRQASPLHIHRNVPGVLAKG